jgi:dephospho-CoA kinase
VAINPLNALKVMSGNGLCSDIAATYGRDETARNNQIKCSALLESIMLDKYNRESVANIMKTCRDTKCQRRRAKIQLLYK